MTGLEELSDTIGVINGYSIRGMETLRGLYHIIRMTVASLEDVDKSI